MKFMKYWDERNAKILPGESSKKTKEQKKQKKIIYYY